MPGFFSKKITLKATAAILLPVWLLAEAAQAAPLVEAVSRANTAIHPSNPSASDWASIIRNPSLLEAAPGAVTIREAHAGTNGKLIIHLQDAHANPGAQKHLAEALDHWMARYPVRMVLSEGGEGEAGVSALKSAADPATWKRVAPQMLRDAIIAGEEYLQLISDHGMTIRGIEDEQLYRANVEIYRELAAGRELRARFLPRVRAAIGALKERRYPDLLLRYEARHSTSAEPAVSMEPLLELARGAGVHRGAEYPSLDALERLIREEKLIDFDRLNRGDPAETQRYEEYSRRLRSAEWTQMLEEAERLEAAIYGKLLDSPDQRRLRALDEWAELLEKAFSIRLTNREFERLERLRPGFAPQSWQAWLNRQLADASLFDRVVADEPAVAESMDRVFRFYDLVRRRDEAFVERAEQALRESRSDAAFLITGGYHTGHLIRLLRERGYSCIVAAPKIDTETDLQIYEKVLLQPEAPDVDTLRSRLATPAIAAARMAAFSNRPAYRELLPRVREVAAARMAAGDPVDREWVRELLNAFDVLIYGDEEEGYGEEWKHGAADEATEEVLMARIEPLVSQADGMNELNRDRWIREFIPQLLEYLNQLDSNTTPERIQAGLLGKFNHLWAAPRGYVVKQLDWDGENFSIYRLSRESRQVQLGGKPAYLIFTDGSQIDSMGDEGYFGYTDVDAVLDMGTRVLSIHEKKTEDKITNFYTPLKSHSLGSVSDWSGLSYAKFRRQYYTGVFADFFAKLHYSDRYNEYAKHRFFDREEGWTEDGLLQDSVLESIQHQLKTGSMLSRLAVEIAKAYPPSSDQPERASSVLRQYFNVLNYLYGKSVGSSAGGTYREFMTCFYARTRGLSVEPSSDETWQIYTASRLMNIFAARRWGLISDSEWTPESILKQLQSPEYDDLLARRVRSYLQAGRGNHSRMRELAQWVLQTQFALDPTELPIDPERGAMKDLLDHLDAGDFRAAMRREGVMPLDFIQSPPAQSSLDKLLSSLRGAGEWRADAASSSNLLEDILRSFAKVPPFYLNTTEVTAYRGQLIMDGLSSVSAWMNDRQIGLIKQHLLNGPKQAARLASVRYEAFRLEGNAADAAQVERRIAELFLPAVSALEPDQKLYATVEVGTRFERDALADLGFMVKRGGDAEIAAEIASLIEQSRIESMSLSGLDLTLTLRGMREAGLPDIILRRSYNQQFSATIRSAVEPRVLDNTAKMQAVVSSLAAGLRTGDVLIDVTTLDAWSSGPRVMEFPADPALRETLSVALGVLDVNLAPSQMADASEWREYLTASAPKSPSGADSKTVKTKAVASEREELVANIADAMDAWLESWPGQEFGQRQDLAAGLAHYFRILTRPLRESNPETSTQTLQQIGLERLAQDPSLYKRIQTRQIDPLTLFKRVFVARRRELRDRVKAWQNNGSVSDERLLALAHDLNFYLVKMRRMVMVFEMMTADSMVLPSDREAYNHLLADLMFTEDVHLKISRELVTHHIMAQDAIDQEGLTVSYLEDPADDAAPVDAASLRSMVSELRGHLTQDISVLNDGFIAATLGRRYEEVLKLTMDLESELVTEPELSDDAKYLIGLIFQSLIVTRRNHMNYSWAPLEGAMQPSRETAGVRSDDPYVLLFERLLPAAGIHGADVRALFEADGARLAGGEKKPLSADGKGHRMLTLGEGEKLVIGSGAQVVVHVVDWDQLNLKADLVVSADMRIPVDGPTEPSSRAIPSIEYRRFARQNPDAKPSGKLVHMKVAPHRPTLEDLLRQSELRINGKEIVIKAIDFTDEKLKLSVTAPRSIRVRTDREYRGSKGARLAGMMSEIFADMNRDLKQMVLALNDGIKLRDFAAASSTEAAADTAMRRILRRMPWRDARGVIFPWRSTWLEYWEGMGDAAQDVRERAAYWYIAMGFQVPRRPDGGVNPDFERLRSKFDAIYSQAHRAGYNGASSAPVLLDIRIPRPGHQPIPAQLTIPTSGKLRRKAMPVIIIYAGLTNGGQQPYFDELEHMLVRRGFAVLRPDLPGHGRNHEPIKAAAELNEFTAACLNYLETNPDYSFGSAGLFGFSFGGNAALRAYLSTELRGRLFAVVSMNPPLEKTFLDRRAIGRHREFLGYVFGENDLEKIRDIAAGFSISVSSLDRDMNFSDFMYIQGGADSDVSHSDGLRLRELIGEDSGPVYYDPSGRHYFFGNRKSRAFARTARFFRDKLPAETQAARLAVDVALAEEPVSKEFVAPVAWMESVSGAFFPFHFQRSHDPVTGRGDWGVGDFESAMAASDLYRDLGLKVQQHLPLSWSGAFDSPYAENSSRAIDPRYISVPMLIDDMERMVRDESAAVDLAPVRDFLSRNAGRIRALREASEIDHMAVIGLKMEALELLWRAYRSAPAADGTALGLAHRSFLESNADWLEDHMLYVLLKEENLERKPMNGWDWRTWETGLRDREPGAIASAKARLRDRLDFYMFVQFVADRQFQTMKGHARANGSEIAVDIPFARDGADVWIHKDTVFGLRKENGYRRLVTQGVPAEPAYPAGQYWQFYPYDWSNPATADYLKRLFAFHQNRATYIRLDHVLGFFRHYLFTEDVAAQMTLGRLGLDDAFRRIRGTAVSQAAGSPQDAGRIRAEAVEQARKVLYERLRGLDPAAFGLPEDAVRYLFGPDGGLTPDAAVTIARETPRDQYGLPVPEGSHWDRRSEVVEAKVHLEKPVWDYLRLTPSAGAGDAGFFEEYLFNGEGPQTGDSVRLSYFKPTMPSILSDFLALAQAKGTTVIFETLGTVPQEIQDFVVQLAGYNYFPVMWGLSPESAYHASRHTPNSMATFGLHDASNIRTRWEKEMSDDEKNRVLDQLLPGLPESERAAHRASLTPQVHQKLLEQVFLSKALLAIPTWFDVFGLGEEHRFNVPGVSTGQWRKRLPSTVQELTAAARGEASTVAAESAVRLLKDLVAARNQVFAVPADRLLLRANPDVQSGVVQRRRIPADGSESAEPFDVEVYTRRSVERVAVRVWNEADTAGQTFEMRRIDDQAGLPDDVSRWAIRLRPLAPGVHFFELQATAGDATQTSATGRLIAEGARLASTQDSNETVLTDDQDAVAERNQRIIRDFEQLSGVVKGVDMGGLDAEFANKVDAGAWLKNARFISYDLPPMTPVALEDLPGRLVLQGAESTGLGSGSVDVVTINMPSPGTLESVLPGMMREARRILKPEGRLVLVIQRPKAGEAVVQSIDELVRRPGPGKIDSVPLALRILAETGFTAQAPIDLRAAGSEALPDRFSDLANNYPSTRFADLLRRSGWDVVTVFAEPQPAGARLAEFEERVREFASILQTDRLADAGLHLLGMLAAMPDILTGMERRRFHNLISNWQEKAGARRKNNVLQILDEALELASTDELDPSEARKTIQRIDGIHQAASYQSRTAITAEHLLELCDLGAGDLVLSELSRLPALLAEQAPYAEVWATARRNGFVEKAVSIDDSIKAARRLSAEGRQFEAGALLKRADIQQKATLRFEPRTAFGQDAQKILVQMHQESTRRPVKGVDAPLSLKQAREAIVAQFKSGRIDSPEWGDLTARLMSSRSGRISFAFTDARGNVRKLIFDLQTKRPAEVLFRRVYQPTTFAYEFILSYVDADTGQTFSRTFEVKRNASGRPDLDAENLIKTVIHPTPLRHRFGWEAAYPELTAQFDSEDLGASGTHRDMEVYYAANDRGNITVKNRRPALFVLGFEPGQAFWMRRTWDDARGRPIFTFIALDSTGDPQIRDGHLDLRVFTAELGGRDRTRVTPRRIDPDAFRRQAVVAEDAAKIKPLLAAHIRSAEPESPAHPAPFEGLYTRSNAVGAKNFQAKGGDDPFRAIFALGAPNRWYELSRYYDADLRRTVYASIEVEADAQGRLQRLEHTRRLHQLNLKDGNVLKSYAVRPVPAAVPSDPSAARLAEFSETFQVTHANKGGVHLHPSQRSAHLANWIMQDHQVQIWVKNLKNGRTAEADDPIQILSINIEKGDKLELKLVSILRNDPAAVARVRPAVERFFQSPNGEIENLITRQNYLRDILLPDTQNDQSKAQGARLALTSRNVGHRGRGDGQVENTVPAFKSAVAAGAEELECDIRLSADGKIFVFHDLDLHRMTQGKRSDKAEDLTLAELQSISLHEKWMPSGTIPTLEEVIDVAKQANVPLQIEIKSGDGIVPKLIETLTRMDFLDQAIVISFIPEYLAELKRLAPRIQTALITMPQDGSVYPPDTLDAEEKLYPIRSIDQHIRYAKEHGIEGLDLHLSDWKDPPTVDQIRKSGLKTYAYGIRDRADMALAIATGIEHIANDSPREFADVIAGMREEEAMLDAPESEFVLSASPLTDDEFNALSEMARYEKSDRVANLQYFGDYQKFLDHRAGDDEAEFRLLLDYLVLKLEGINRADLDRGLIRLTNANKLASDRGDVEGNFAQLRARLLPETAKAAAPAILRTGKRGFHTRPGELLIKLLASISEHALVMVAERDDFMGNAFVFEGDRKNGLFVRDKTPLVVYLEGIRADVTRHQLEAAAKVIAEYLGDRKNADQIESELDRAEDFEALELAAQGSIRAEYLDRLKAIFNPAAPLSESGSDKGARLATSSTAGFNQMGSVGWSDLSEENRRRMIEDYSVIARGSNLEGSVSLAGPGAAEWYVTGQIEGRTLLVGDVREALSPIPADDRSSRESKKTSQDAVDFAEKSETNLLNFVIQKIAESAGISADKDVAIRVTIGADPGLLSTPRGRAAAIASVEYRVRQLIVLRRADTQLFFELDENPALDPEMIEAAKKIGKELFSIQAPKGAAHGYLSDDVTVRFKGNNLYEQRLRESETPAIRAAVLLAAAIARAEDPAHLPQPLLEAWAALARVVHVPADVAGRIVAGTASVAERRTYAFKALPAGLSVSQMLDFFRRGARLSEISA